MMMATARGVCHGSTGIDRWGGGRGVVWWCFRGFGGFYRLQAGTVVLLSPQQCCTVSHGAKKRVLEFKTGLMCVSFVFRTGIPTGRKERAARRNVVLVCFDALQGINSRYVASLRSPPTCACGGGSRSRLCLRGQHRDLPPLFLWFVCMYVYCCEELGGAVGGARGCIVTKLMAFFFGCFFFFFFHCLVSSFCTVTCRPAAPADSCAVGGAGYACVGVY